MVFKGFVGIAILIGSVCSRISENESDQYLIVKQPGVTDENVPTVNRIKRFCSGNICSDVEKDAVLNSQCMLSGCAKRSLQDEVGPFWANRGKRNPSYKSEPLYANEPHWVLVRRADDDILPYKYNFEPFFITRGKKDKKIQEDDESIIQEIFAKMRIRNHQDMELLQNAN